MNNAYADLSAPNTIRFERVLPGPIERVWDYLTVAEKRASWFAGGEFDLREGGAGELIFHHSQITPADDKPPPHHSGHCGEIHMALTVLRAEPPHLLSFSWSGESTVTIELSPRGEDVLLVLTHRRIGERSARVDFSSGWHMHLDMLADHLNDRTPKPIWATISKLEPDYEERVPN